MTEYSTSPQFAQVAGRVRPNLAALAVLHRPIPAWRTRSRAAAALLLLGVVACTSPSPADRGGSAVASVPGIPAAQPVAAPESPVIDARMRPGYPSRVALLLPVSGRQQLAGIAVRDGFMAAVMSLAASQRPAVSVYDTAAGEGAVTAYRRALADGAEFVVGPLTKEELQAVADSGAVSVPTLGLNYLPDGMLPPGFLYQYALDPEDEARQVARRILAEGHTHGVALVPDNEWGQRLLRAFDTEFSASGGRLLSRTYYDTGARDYSQPITRMLLIDESRARANALATALGTRFEFEPRSRSDAQFVFVAAQPLQGRSLRPALRFHLTQDLPVYATSDVFDPDADGNADLDGVAFPDMPWLVAPDAAGNDLRASLTSFWPARSRGRGRLYAFGYDAFRLIPALRSTGPAAAVTAGLTGRLTVDERGQVRRELDWAEVEGGRIRARTTAGGGTLVR